jgi:RNase adaptor protein for sRNA GlmZ degradation
VESIFDYNKYQQIFFPLIVEINLFMLSKAAGENVPSVIMTNCYSHPEDEEYIRRIIEIVEGNNGEVNFVRIKCGNKELLRRVTDESRKKYGKVKDPDRLKSIMEEKDLIQEIPFVNSFTIDNTDISAKEAADRIKEHYTL